VTPDARTTATVVGALLAFVLVYSWLALGALPWGGWGLAPVLALPLVMRTRAWARWVALLSHREPGTGLAVFRIALGLCAAYILVEMLLRGAVEPLWVDRAYGGMRTVTPSRLVTWLGGPTPEVVFGLVWATLGLAAAQVLGLGGRWVPLLLLWFISSLTGLNNQSGGSYDELFENAQWILFLSSSTATLSLDSRLRTGSWTSDEPVPAWPRWLAVGQLVLVYWTTGLQKVSAHWTPGGEFSALYYIFQQPEWQRFDMTWVAHVYPLTQIGTAVTWFWEVLAPIWLLAFWYRATRTRPGRLREWSNSWDLRLVYAAIGATFHVLIFVFMDVGPFGFVTLSYYACLFSPDEYRAFVTRRRATRAETPDRTTGPSDRTATYRSARSTSGP
jgi:hypothetical protein